MLDQEFPIPLDDDVTRIATITTFVGGLFVRYSSWTIAGWMIIMFGLMTLWLAHQIAIAPQYDESGQWIEPI